MLILFTLDDRILIGLLKNHLDVFIESIEKSRSPGCMLFYFYYFLKILI